MDDTNDALFAGSGETRARCRVLDWASTPLGPVAGWPQSLRTVVNLCLSSPVASFVWWGPACIQFHNDAALTIIRAGCSATLGKPGRIAWADMWPVVGTSVERVLATGKGVRDNDVPMVPDHEGARGMVWFSVSYSPVYDEQGVVAGVFCSILETTAHVRAEIVLRGNEERQAFLLKLSDALRPLASSAEMERIWIAIERARAEEALRESEERLSLAIEIGEMATWDWDLRSGKVRWNDRHFLMQGYAAGEVTPSYEAWVARVHPEDREETIALIEKARDDKITYVHEFRTVPVNGKVVWCSARGRFFYDADGQPYRMIGVMEDIRVRKETEAALHVLNETLERRVTARTAERDTLRRQLAEAEEAERRRLARELHDQLGQELTAFRLGLDDALRLAATRNGPGAPTALVERLTSLQTVANHMTMAVRSIAIDLRPPELDDVGLGSAIETYVREWSSRYAIAAEVETSRLEESTIEPDIASAVYRILQEALTNVAKHAAASHVSVIGGCSNGELRLVIEDSGSGFDTDAPRNTTLGRQLGVAGMQERAALLKGTVSVESTPAIGTTVYIRIPLEDAPRTPASD